MSVNEVENFRVAKLRWSRGFGAGDLERGAFGSDDAWIDDAILRALRLVRNQDLEVEVVSYGAPSSGLRNLVWTFTEETAS
jgi:hypothetical protein